MLTCPLCTPGHSLCTMYTSEPRSHSDRNCTRFCRLPSDFFIRFHASFFPVIAPSYSQLLCSGRPFSQATCRANVYTWHSHVRTPTRTLQSTLEDTFLPQTSGALSSAGRRRTGTGRKRSPWSTTRQHGACFHWRDHAFFFFRWSVQDRILPPRLVLTLRTKDDGAQR